MFPPLSHFKGDEVGNSKRILWGTTLALQYPSRADKASLDIFLLIKRLKVRLSKLNDDLTRIKKCVKESSDIELMGASDKEFAPMVRSEVTKNLAHHIASIKNALCVFEQAQKALAVNPLPEEWKKLFVETIRYWEDRVEYTSSILSEMLSTTCYGSIPANEILAFFEESKQFQSEKLKNYFTEEAQKRMETSIQAVFFNDYVVKKREAAEEKRRIAAEQKKQQKKLKKALEKTFPPEYVPSKMKGFVLVGIGPTARHTVVFVGWFGGVTTNSFHARLFTHKDSAKKYKEYTGIIPELQSQGYHFLVCSKDANENIKLVDDDENSTTNTVFCPKFWNITELLMFTAAYSDLYRCGYKWLKTNWLSLEKSYKATEKPMKFLSDQIKKIKARCRYRDFDLWHNIGVLENTFNILQTEDVSSELSKQSYEDVFKNNMRHWKASFDKNRNKNSK